MKPLFSFLEEAGIGPAGAATPGNTMGMGNPTADDGSGKGSEPLTAKSETEKPRKKRRKKGEEE